MEPKGHTDQRILDACCGGRMFWFDREDPRALFVDVREEEKTLCDGRRFAIRPDAFADFTAMPFADGAFKLVVFDPPHLVEAGPNSWQAFKYGKLSDNWRDQLRKGFAECFRVLSGGGTLIFKWNEEQISVKEVLACTKEKPLFGNRRPGRSKTHWIVFMKEGK